MSHVKTLVLAPDEVAVVLMALAGRSIECERYASNGHNPPYWAAAAAETAALQARLAALPYKEPQITDAELAALEEEERLEDARITAEEDEYEASREAYEDSKYDDREYEYEDRLDRLTYVYSNED